jgi:hypothetical protein
MNESFVIGNAGGVSLRPGAAHAAGIDRPLPPLEDDAAAALLEHLQI